MQGILRKLHAQTGEGMVNLEARDRDSQESKGARRQQDIRRSRGQGRSTSEETCARLCVIRSSAICYRKDA